MIIRKLLYKCWVEGVCGKILEIWNRKFCVCTLDLTRWNSAAVTLWRMHENVICKKQPLTHIIKGDLQVSVSIKTTARIFFFIMVKGSSSLLLSSRNSRSREQSYDCLLEWAGANSCFLHWKKKKKLAVICSPDTQCSVWSTQIVSN